MYNQMYMSVFSDYTPIILEHNSYKHIPTAKTIKTKKQLRQLMNW